MTSLHFSQREIALANEGRLKFQGVAKVNLGEICFDSQSNRQLDQKNVERLCKIFREEGCHHLAVENRIPVIVSPRGLAAALAAANISAHTLQSHRESEVPHLRFPPGQLHGLHGRHRVAAGLDVLLVSTRWWAVDIYLDDVGEELRTSLIEEYANKKPPSDGEIYRKIRQYASDGNVHGELRWRARLSSNNLIRFEAVSKKTLLRHAFDVVMGTPGHRSAMRISVLCAKIDETQEVVRYLNHVRDFWYGLANHDVASVTKIDQITVETLQLMSPSIEAREVKGLVLSGQVFSKFNDNERVAIWERLQSYDGLIPSLHTFFEDFKCLESWAQCLSRLFPPGEQMRETMERRQPLADEGSPCLVQTSEAEFRPRAVAMPRDPKRKDRLAKPRNEKADEYLVSDMTCLAQRLRFESAEITHLVNQSPDRLIARETLFRARKPSHFRYEDRTFNSLVDRIVSCFATATRKEVCDDQPVFASPPVRRRARCGHPTERALMEVSPFLFLDHMYATTIPDRVTSFFVRRCVYLKFFGPLTAASGEDGPFVVSDHSSGPKSPLFVTQSDGMDTFDEDGTTGNPSGPSVPLESPAADSNQGRVDKIATMALASQHSHGRQEVAPRTASSEVVLLQQTGADMTQRIADTESRVAQPSRHSGEVIQRERESQGDVDVQTVEPELPQIASTENIENEQRQLDPPENGTSTGVGYVTAEEIDELLTEMLQEDAEQRAAGEQGGSPRGEQPGSTLSIPVGEAPSAEQTTTVQGQSREETQDPHRLTQWNYADLIAEMRQRDSAYHDGYSASIPYGFPQEAAEDQAVAGTVEPQRSETGSVDSPADIVDDDGARSTEETTVDTRATDRILPQSRREHEEGPIAQVANEASRVVSTLPHEAYEPAADRPLQMEVRAHSGSIPEELPVTKTPETGSASPNTAANRKRQGIVGGISKSHEARGEVTRDGDVGDSRAGSRVQGSRIQKKSQPRTTQKDRIRQVVRDTAAEIELDDRADSPGELELGPVEADSITPHSPLGQPRVHFAASPEVQPSESTVPTDDRRLTHFNFRELARGTLTDPGGVDEALSPGLSLPSVEAKPSQENGVIHITFYILERDGWQVAHVVPVPASDPSTLGGQCQREGHQENSAVRGVPGWNQEGYLKTTGISLDHS
ncbi:hypothetical protein ZTR_09842 [Talaromyces verruculosus]|nr:hypothetical protein ZTR_09842 [Talaromyces verruculosus]